MLGHIDRVSGRLANRTLLHTDGGQDLRPHTSRRSRRRGSKQWHEAHEAIPGRAGLLLTYSDLGRSELFAGGLGSWLNSLCKQSVHWETLMGD